jgi:hypothetical protein
MFYYTIFVANNPEFAAEEVRLSKCGGLSDAHEIMAGKLREKGIVITVVGLRDALKARLEVTAARQSKSGLIHRVTEMLAQRSEAGLGESAGGSSGGRAGGGSSNRSTTVSQPLCPSIVLDKRTHILLD